MERETLLAVLIALLAGAAILVGAGMPTRARSEANARLLERKLWRRIWLPLVPASMVAATLCGWAIGEPDPVPERVPLAVLLASVPLLFLFARTAVRAGWSLVRDDGDPGSATVGMLKPWVLISPHLARALDDRALEAALEHERAHARHRDPLRIWIAQIATDLQWPWPQASQRFRRWIVALELARDEEVRVRGVDGSDLARAILAAARISRGQALEPIAALIGAASVLRERIDRLTSPGPENSAPLANDSRLLWIFGSGVLAAVALGSVFGETVIAALLRIAA
jgi:hypothetical protein